MDQNFWIAFGAIGAMLQALVVMAVALFAKRQLRETQRARSVASFFPLFESINSAESAALRRRLHSEIRGDPAQYSDEEEDVVNGIVNQFDYLGFLAEKNLIDQDLVVAFYYGTVIRAWRSAEPYVDLQRSLRGTNFAGFFEGLKDQCLEFVETTLPDVPIKRFEGLAPEEERS